MTKKKHKMLPPDMLDAFKYEIAAELGLLNTNLEDGLPETSEAGLAPTEGISPIYVPDSLPEGIATEDEFKGE